MLVKVVYALCGVEDAELFSWDNEEQRRRFEERIEEIVRRGGRFSVDASPRHRAVLMSTHCKRCSAVFMASKCPVCGWVVGTSPSFSTDDPWSDQDDHTPLEKGKGRSR